MKPSNKDMQSDEWDEFYKNTGVKQNLVEIFRCNDEHIVKPQSWNFTRINPIKNFITLETNDYSVKEPFFERDGEKDGMRL